MLSRRWFLAQLGGMAVGATALPGCAPSVPGSTGPAMAAGGWLAREAYLMGTVLRITARGDGGSTPAAALEAAFAEVRRLEGVLSSWRADTEIGRLNRAPVGEGVWLGEELATLLHEAERWTGETGGAFNPTVGALIDAWDLRGEGRVPTSEELARARASTGWNRFAMQRSASVGARLDEHAWIDTGGFGKGAALASAGEQLARLGVRDATLDFGGQLLAMGAAPGEQTWPVAVAHPVRRDEPFTELRLRDASAATTAQSERWVEVAGRRIGHVLDPRTGQPVPAWGSVTVVAADAVAADVLSTALFVMGPEEGARWAAEQTAFGALFLIDRNGRIEVRQNAAMGEFHPADHINGGGNGDHGIRVR